MSEGLDSIQFHTEVLTVLVSILLIGREGRGNLTSSSKIFKVREIDRQTLHTQANIAEQPHHLSHLQSME